MVGGGVGGVVAIVGVGVAVTVDVSVGVGAGVGVGSDKVRKKSFEGNFRMKVVDSFLMRHV